MKRAFKNGDRVYYGVVPGVLLGIYNTTQVLFFAEYERDTFCTSKDIMATGDRLGDILFLFISEYFGLHNLNNEANKRILKQKRFSIVPLQELHHASYHANNGKTPLGSLIHKRHLYLTMVKKYNKEAEGDVSRVHRLCSRIEEIQAEIELTEEKALASAYA